MGEFDGYLPGHPVDGRGHAEAVAQREARAGRPAGAGRRRSPPTRGATRGSFVAMDPQNGQIYAMGSAPTYDPSIFTRPERRSYLY